MTAVLEPSIEVAALIADQQRFDATRPACPDWCDGTCRTLSYSGTAVIHDSHAVVLPCLPEVLNAPPATVSVRASRLDELDQPSRDEIELGVENAQSYLGDRVPFTAQQAYDLGAALMAAARQLPCELEVLASDVKIGDLINVDGIWLHVYGVFADEPSDNVQITVTADPEDLSDFQYRDENPQHLTLTDKVRIRRHVPAGENR